jgi:hypothetical protein
MSEENLWPMLFCLFVAVVGFAYFIAAAHDAMRDDPGGPF